MYVRGYGTRAVLGVDHWWGAASERWERTQVVPVFAGGLDFSLPVRKFFYDPLGSGKAFVDCVVSLTGFALVGGPARQDAPKVHPEHAQPHRV